jgi:outer membrane protein
LKTKIIAICVLAGYAALAYAQSQGSAAIPNKVATIQVQAAILSTADGKKAQNDLTTKFNGRKQALEKKQSEIQGLQEQLKRGSATMNQDARDKLARDIDAGQRALKYDGEEFEADVQQEEGKIMQDLGAKMMDIIVKYATKNGFAMVINVSDPQTPVLWADPAVDITQEIIKLYDQAHPGGAATSAPAKPATPPPASPTKPVTPPATPPVKPLTAPPKK